MSNRPEARSWGLLEAPEILVSNNSWADFADNTDGAVWTSLPSMHIHPPPAESPEQSVTFVEIRDQYI